MEPISTAEVPFVERERKPLSKVFDHYLRPLVRDPDSNLRIMSVGCAFGSEAGSLLKTFPNATYMGIDIDAYRIDLARETNADLGKKCVFEAADAREKSAFNNGPWDIIIVRHPQVLGSTDPNLEKDWTLIMENCFFALDRGRVLFISTFSEQERKRILEYLNKHRIEIRVAANERNIYSTRNRGIPTDSFVIIGKKK